jgi:hypothetical protein
MPALLDECSKSRGGVKSQAPDTSAEGAEIYHARPRILPAALGPKTDQGKVPWSGLPAIEIVIPDKPDEATVIAKSLMSWMKDHPTFNLDYFNPAGDPNRWENRTQMMNLNLKEVEKVLRTSEVLIVEQSMDKLKRHNEDEQAKAAKENYRKRRALKQNEQESEPEERKESGGEQY